MKQTPATFVVFALAAFCGCRGSKDIVWSFATPWPWVLAGDSQALTPAIDSNAVFFAVATPKRGNRAKMAAQRRQLHFSPADFRGNGHRFCLRRAERPYCRLWPR